MAEYPNAVTLRGNPLTLVGDGQIEVGDSIPSILVTNGEMKDVDITHLKGKVVILTTVPSLDTSVCDTEARRLNEEAAALGDDAAIVLVSMDLPFAQKRWSEAAKVDKVEMFSDYRGARLGSALGVLIKELYLLARSVYVVDKEGIVRYSELVREIAEEPDYDRAIAEAKKLS
jgi:thiol peroxidase